MYGAVLSGHYIVVFISLMVVYYKLLRFIAHVKKLQGKSIGYHSLNIEVTFSTSAECILSITIIIIITVVEKFILRVELQVFHSLWL